MKKKLILLLMFGITISSLGFNGISLAQEEDHEANRICETYDIYGPSGIRKDKTIQYKVVISGSEQILDNDQIKFNLFQKNKFITNQKGNAFIYSFNSQGEYNLKAEFSDLNGCSYNIEKEIKSYEKSILYIGDELKEFELGFQENFEKHGTLLSKINIGTKKIIGEEDILTRLSEKIIDIKNADIVIINSKFFDQIFSILGKIGNNQEFNLNDKQIFVLSDLNRNFLKRILAKYIKYIGVSELYVLDNSYFLNFFSNLSFNKDATNEEYIKIFSLDFSQVSKYLLLSYIVDNLINNGFPINLISLFLSLGLAALIVSFFRQVIGFSVFGIYSPIFFATSMAVFGFNLSIILFFIAIFAVILTRLFAKKIYLLYSAKLTILIILYFLFMLMILGFDKILNINLIDFSVFNNGLVIFPIIFLIVVADKVFYEGFKVTNKTWIISFFEFLIVSVIVYSILIWEPLNQILLSYPESILIIFILNILIGRFTGLQLLEYFRFIPLLQKESENEIEE